MKSVVDIWSSYKIKDNFKTEKMCTKLFLWCLLLLCNIPGVGLEIISVSTWIFHNIHLVLTDSRENVCMIMLTESEAKKKNNPKHKPTNDITWMDKI